MAYTYEQRHDLAKALELYQQAEAATNFSPDDIKNIELGRALRGEGFALTDMHKLDEAEAKYQEALKIDPNDQKSKNELEYIREVREKSGSTGNEPAALF
ncbi:MAG: tetratricopeptide repeat protein [Rhodanobacteraceae bacterium]